MSLFLLHGFVIVAGVAIAVVIGVVTVVVVVVVLASVVFDCFLLLRVLL